MTGPRVVVVGSLNCDVIVHVDRLPSSGETILGDRGQLAAGGKGLNQAVAAARAGAPTAIVGRLGEDGFGQRLRDHARGAGVDCRFLDSVEGTLTGFASITVSAEGANMIAVAPGANMLLDGAALEAAAPSIAAAGALLVQLETPFATVEKALHLARAGDTLSILNPAPANRDALPLCALADVVTPNEHELELLADLPVGEDEDRLRAAIAILRDRGARHVVVTLGGRGCAALWEDDYLRLPSFPVEVVDTTGAGDTFNGALAAVLAEGMAIADALRFASAAAAISVSRATAEGAAPERQEILAFLAAHA